MPPPRYKFKASDIIRSGRIQEKQLNELKLWCTQNFSFLTDEQLVLFLLCSNNVVENAKITIQQHFRTKVKGRELFNNTGIDAEDMKKTLQVFDIAVVPARTSDNEVVAIGNLRNTSFTSFHIDKLFKLVCMILDYSLWENPPSGIIAIIDMKGAGLLHLTRFKIGAVLKFAQFIQEGLQLQIRQIHILNTVSFIDKILFIVKPLIRKELLDATIFHQSNADFGKIFKNLPKNCLPEDYGGSLPELGILARQTYEEMKQLTSFYSDLEEQVQIFEENN